jgi:hypothetical protein
LNIQALTSFLNGFVWVYIFLWLSFVRMQILAKSHAFEIFWHFVEKDQLNTLWWYHAKAEFNMSMIFLACLKTKKHSFKVGNLVKARTREASSLLTSLYDSNHANIEDDREISQYVKYSESRGSESSIVPLSYVIKIAGTRVRYGGESKYGRY